MQHSEGDLMNGEKKEIFYTATLFDAWKKQDTGIRIEIVSWLSTFLLRDKHGRYLVIEELSGHEMARGITKEEAVKNAQTKLANAGKKQTLTKVVEVAISKDISPKFRPQKRKAIKGWLADIEEANS